MVRLLRCFDREHQAVVLGFNPTMVRLLRAGFYQSVLKFPRFQSHNGAIATGK